MEAFGVVVRGLKGETGNVMQTTRASYLGKERMQDGKERKWRTRKSLEE